MASLVDINYIPLIPLEIIGVIIVNTLYEKAPLGLKNVTFTTAELKRIEPLFKRFCKEVRVLEDPTFQELDDLFTYLYDQPKKFRQDIDGKQGIALMFHYLGHGTMFDNTTHMWLNQKDEETKNPFPIESKLKNFAAAKNTIVLATLNCCRNSHQKQNNEKPVQNLETEEKAGTDNLGGVTKAKNFEGQYLLLFASPAKESAPATENFGQQYADNLKKIMEKGYIHLPDDFQTQQHAKEETRHITEKIHLDVILDEVESQPQMAGRNLGHQLEKGVYTGQMFNGLRHGRGKFEAKGLFSYDGLWYQGKMHGRGIYEQISQIYCPASFYEGEFRSHKFHGKGSYKQDEFFFENAQFLHNAGLQCSIPGESYEGDFKDGLKSGKGIQTMQNGDIYDGEWVEGKRQGKGVCKFANGDKYDGQWRQNNILGYGQYINADGTVQVGTFVNGKLADQLDSTHDNTKDQSIFVQNNQQTYMNVEGFYTGNMLKKKRHGKGEFEICKGEIGDPDYEYCQYKGEWKNDLMDGQGKHTKENAEKDYEYTGGWCDGKMYGFGVEYTIRKNGAKRNCTRTQGFRQNGQLHGQVQQTLDDGTTYEGDMQYGKKYGKGSLKKQNGECYEGDFRDDQYYGEGKLSGSFGTYEGDFKRNKYHGDGKLVLSDGTMSYTGTFKDGLYHGEGELSVQVDKKKIIYYGFFSKGLKHGTGTEKSESSIFDGVWKMGMKWSGELRYCGEQSQGLISIWKDGNEIQHHQDSEQNQL